MSTVRMTHNYVITEPEYDEVREWCRENLSRYLLIPGIQVPQTRLRGAYFIPYQDPMPDFYKDVNPAWLLILEDDDDVMHYMLRWVG